MGSTSLEVSEHRGSDAERDLEFDAFLDACLTSFSQQTPSWRDVITQIDRDEAIVLACRRAGRLVGLLPLFRFEGPRGVILTSVPQPGPLGGIACSPNEDRAEIFASLMRRCFLLAESTGCDLLSIISNPFWQDADLYRQVRPADFVLENRLHALVLGEDVNPDGTFANASSSVRRNLKKANAAGLVIDEEQSRANVDQWYAIHEARHSQIGATPLPRKLFEATLEHAVPKGRARFFFVRLAESGEMIAGGLYLCHGQVVDAYMPAMNDRYAELRPNHFLAAHSIAWARSEGYQFYNWQGSPPGGGVERFKLSWGSRPFDYQFLTWVTGDASAFVRAKIDEIVEEYRWHYVLPFDCVGKSEDSAIESRQPSLRSDVWKSLEGAE